MAVIDGSAGGWRAFDMALKTAAETSGVVLAALPGPRLPRGAGLSGEVDDALRSATALRESVVAHAIEIAEMHGVTLRVVRMHGRGVRPITRTVERERPVILILARKRSALDWLRRYSVGEVLAARLECHVVVVG